MKANLFYDGQCPLCTKEINLLSRWKNSELQLTNLHEAQKLAKSKNEMLSVLHYQTSDGDWLLGLDATVAAWSHTKLGWLFKPLRWPLIKPLADYIYNNWAKRRACKLAYK